MMEVYASRRPSVAAFTAVHERNDAGKQRMNRLLRGGFVVIAAVALAIASHTLGGGGSRTVVLRELEGAHLPSFTPAALALRNSGGDYDVEGMKAKLGKMTAKAHGDHALGNKALEKIMAAARAAAMHSNSLIKEADESLRESQKELGSNAVHLNLLTGGSIGQTDTDEPLSSTDLAALIERSRTSVGAKKALLEASKAAAHNKALMQSARDILKESAETLGDAAVALPSLGAALPSPLGGHATGDAGKGGKGKGGESAAVDRKAELKFVRATRFAREY